MLLTHIAVAGPRIRADAAKLARAAKASVIICGHSHVPFLGQERGLSIFNPGSIGPRRFQLPILFGVMELSPTAVQAASLRLRDRRRVEAVAHLRAGTRTPGRRPR